LDIGENPKILPEDQAFALGQIVERKVIGYSIGEPRIIHPDFLRLPVRLKCNNKPFKKDGSSSADPVNISP